MCTFHLAMQSLICRDTCVQLQRGFRIPIETPEPPHWVTQSPWFWSLPTALIPEELGNSWHSLSLSVPILLQKDSPSLVPQFPTSKTGGKSQVLLLSVQ